MRREYRGWGGVRWGQCTQLKAGSRADAPTSAKCGLAIACRPSVSLSVRPSVALVDCDHIYRLEILETNCTDNYPNTFALCSQKAIHLLPGEHGEILGRLEVGYNGKSGILKNEAAISSKRVKIEEKLLWTAYRIIKTHQRSVERYHPRPPTTAPSPKLGVRNPHSNTAF